MHCLHISSNGLAEEIVLTNGPLWAPAGVSALPASLDGVGGRSGRGSGINNAAGFAALGGIAAGRDRNARYCRPQPRPCSVTLTRRSSVPSETEMADLGESGSMRLDVGAGSQFGDELSVMRDIQGLEQQAMRGD